MALNARQKEILRFIMYAVETGGQVYGKADYSNVTLEYTNSSNEHAITIGAGAWYATEAKRLLVRIRSADPSGFASLDTAGISADLDASDWSTYKLSGKPAKVRCISNIINTTVGRQCQNALLDEQMDVYIAFAQGRGVTTAQGQCMCANFQHQGGQNAVTRILAKTPRPYTLDNLYTACQSDTGNQVGAYRSRQKFVYENLKTRMVDAYTTLKVISVATDEVGYLEKRTNSQLDSKTANAGFNNYTKYGLAMGCNGLAWCDAFVDWCFIQAYGRDNARTLLGGFSNYTPTSSDYFKNMGRWHTNNPQAGDVVFFHNSVRINHTGIVYRVEGGVVYTIEGNTSAGTSVVPNGGGVYMKSYSMGNSRISGYGRPNYSLVESDDEFDSSDPESTPQVLRLIRWIPL